MSRVSMLKSRAVRAFFIAMSIEPIHAPSIRRKPFVSRCASHTAMFIGVLIAAALALHAFRILSTAAVVRSPDSCSTSSAVAMLGAAPPVVSVATSATTGESGTGSAAASALPGAATLLAAAAAAPEDGATAAGSRFAGFSFGEAGAALVERKVTAR